MRPAFSRVRSAAAFAALLAALLAAPAVVARLGVLDRATVYATMPVGTGPSAHLTRQIFEETSDIDILFVGSSLMWSGIDAPHVQRELSAALGRDAVVTVLASVWPGLDRDYAFLRDVLPRRRVRLAVIQFPNRDRPTRDTAAEFNRVSDQPHVQAFRFYREGELPEVVEGLPLRARAGLYASAMLGMPRHLLSLVRSDRVAPSGVEETLGTRFQELGFYGAPFEPFSPPPPVLSPDEMIYSPSASSSYRFFDEPLPPYQAHFAALIAHTLAAQGVPAVVLHIPQANEIDAEFVEERVDWLAETGIDAAMVGIPPARLFRGFSEEETLRFFSSDHLNQNGAAFFTRAVTPALLEVYRARAQAD
jgi:hypothetical protein